MQRPHPDDEQKSEVQRDHAWVEAASPSEIAAALKDGELVDYALSGPPEVKPKGD